MAREVIATSTQTNIVLPSSPASSSNITPSVSSPTSSGSSSKHAPHNHLPQPINTIPTKSINFNSLDETMISNNNNSGQQNCDFSSCSIPSLDELVNDCFLKAINLLSDEFKLSLVDKFIDFLTKSHCEENLYFLIDINKYEYNYNLKFNDTNKESVFRLNNTPSPSLLNLKSSSSTLSFESSTKVNKVNSVQSEDHDPQNAFIQTIDDLDHNEDIQSAWDDLKSKQIEDYDDDEDYYSDEELNNLTSNWNFIMNNYIKYDSPNQINISQKLFKEIVEESFILKVHNPIILLKIKNEVMRMLKENGYFEFISQMKKESILKSPKQIVTTTRQKSNSISTSMSTPISPIMSPSDNKDTFINKLSSLPKRSKNGNGSNTAFYQSSTAFSHLNLGTPNTVDSSTSSSVSSISNILGHLKIGNSSANSNANSIHGSGANTPVNSNNNHDFHPRNISSISINDKENKEKDKEISKDSLSSSLKFWRRK
ncbi:unnamed protein product [Candida verbasci]|uniref:RGS domain-containing protein n=1 Tax=Candida verbasci TaxID=1227364 RepID=A0A9W4X9C4_9ASCO|nr:unnamed protein product [Candida verbasci]